MEDKVDLIVDILLLASCSLKVKIGNSKSIIFTLKSGIGSVKTGVEVVNGVNEVVSLSVECVKVVLFNGKLVLQGS